MSLLAPLLKIQDLDTAADAARARSAGLPEREEVPRLEAAIAESEGRMAAHRARLQEVQAEEEALGREVTETSRAIEAAEVERYSGKRAERDKAAAHDEAQAALREKQGKLEERQMELLEQVDALDTELAALEATRQAQRAQVDAAREAIRAAEEKVAAEVDRLGAQRADLASKVPKPVLAKYDSVRAQPRANGRGAAILSKGVCRGCHTTLPSLQNTRMLAEPEDALIQCPKCQRVLVR
jgi:predicted  nucleic acid-binding Zn-ribbon protein